LFSFALSLLIVAGSFAIRQSKNDSGAILITGRTLRHWFPYDSWNVRLWLVVCHVKDHVPKFAFVHEVTAFWTLKEVFFFFVA